MPSHPELDLAGVLWRLGATLLLVCINGFFVAAEFALVKVRRARIHELAAEGRRTAQVTKHLLAHLDRYLSACQLGITLASLVLGALGEPAVARLLVAATGAMGLELDPSQPEVRAVSLVFAFATITILHMTLGEQAPKMWALKRAEGMILASSIPLRLFTLLFWPFIWLINAISNAMLRAIGLEPGHGQEPALTTGEIRKALSLSAEAGHIPKRASEIVENVLRVVDMQVRHILVPRVDITHLPLRSDTDEAVRLMRESGHTRFPLCDGELDEVIGIVHSKEVLRCLLDDQPVDLKALARKPLFVPERLPLHALAGQLQRRGEHAAMVVDEHGSVLGMAFLEDAIEEMVGPIVDEFDEPSADVVEIEPGVFEIRGAMPLPDAEKLLELSLEEHSQNTIGGHVMALLGRLPNVGDEVEVGDYRARVTALTSRRVPERIRFERRS
ncbi:MAG: HlyC/CorC family transporter [Deltaproteobacteria bacterium]|jgi:CBS domain containing-hemolysin-like protein|nr:HlyC/CorC family transporter [Deltaproteobacteria bacterium]MBW2535613.1 HlyC/CorC family transporter [Deltaproteobacteria bacterium]